MRLRVSTDPVWTEAVLSNFEAFLLDHASCERKASATALTLVSHYPDKPELVREMITLAQEELEHFSQVVGLLQNRELVLRKDERDHYVRELRKHARAGTEAYLLDRLLIAGIIEARGCERFELLSRVLQVSDLKEFYLELARAEARHHGTFVRLARRYFDSEQVDKRLEELLDVEADIVAALPFRPALH